MLKNKYIFCKILLFTIFLSGCARYNPKPLTKPDGTMDQIEERNIKIIKKELAERDNRKFFDRKLIARGYQPIQLYIQNNSNHILTLDSDNISLPLETEKDVTDKMHRDYLAKITKNFIIGGPILATAEWIQSYNCNSKIDEDLKNKGFFEASSIKIKPHQAFNRVLFVKLNNYNSDFDITLVDMRSNEKMTFDL
jgi:hypothetical protein